jgi:uncharacterized protein with PQ loop repeat
MIVGVLTAIATSIGLAQALALLDQTRKLRRAGSAREVSVSFLAASLTGNVIWLAYGVLRIDPALLIVNCAGILGATATLVTALRLRCRAPVARTASGPRAGLDREPALAMESGVDSAHATEPAPHTHPFGTLPATREGSTPPTGSTSLAGPEFHAGPAPSAESASSAGAAYPPTPAPPRVEQIRLSPATGRHRRLAMLN